MPRTKHSFRHKVWTLITSKAFEYFILLMIGLNTVVLMMKVRLNC